MNFQFFYINNLFIIYRIHFSNYFLKICHFFRREHFSYTTNQLLLLVHSWNHLQSFLFSLIRLNFSFKRLTTKFPWKTTTCSYSEQEIKEITHSPFRSMTFHDWFNHILISKHIFLFSSSFYEVSKRVSQFSLMKFCCNQNCKEKWFDIFQVFSFIFCI